MNQTPLSSESSDPTKRIRCSPSPELLKLERSGLTGETRNVTRTPNVCTPLTFQLTFFTPRVKIYPVHVNARKHHTFTGILD